jgi:hypothetical protein
MKKKRLYLLYLEKSIEALRSSIDRINSVHDKYSIEVALILMANAWELLSKAYLLRSKDGIFLSNGDSISAPKAIYKLFEKKIITDIQEDHIQQIISLRHQASHAILPAVPKEIYFHLFFFVTKTFKEFVSLYFPAYKNRLSGNYLSISFDNSTTYADKVQKLIAKIKNKDSGASQLVWLLERGIRFSGNQYISQNSFEEEIRRLRGRKILPHLDINKYIKNTEMVVVVPVQAPKGYTADITLRKGQKSDKALPVVIKKTNIEEDYPYLTNEIAKRAGKSTPFISKLISNLSLKGKSDFHQAIRTSTKTSTNRYSDKALSTIMEFLANNPSYNPYKAK